MITMYTLKNILKRSVRRSIAEHLYMIASSSAACSEVYAGHSQDYIYHGRQCHILIDQKKKASFNIVKEETPFDCYKRPKVATP